MLDLEPIKRRAEWMRDNADQCERSPGQVSLSGYVAACVDCGKDVPALIAEVERLRRQISGYSNPPGEVAFVDFEEATDGT